MTYESLESRALLASVTINPAQDNTLFQTSSYGPVSNGKGPVLAVGTDHNDGMFMRAVMEFNIASMVPTGATINSVTLTAYEYLNFSAGQVPVELHKATTQWGEGSSATSSITQMPPFYYAATNDTTWTDAMYPNTAWKTAGGDFSSTVSGTTTFGGANQSYTFGSTSQMVADVQSWLNNPSTNYGWFLKGVESPNTDTGKLLGSRESANPPTLTINYTAATTTTPDLAITASHTGNFNQGDTADSYTINVNNAGTGPTSGTVTVTDTVPAGLTLNSASGTGWTVSTSGSVVTATRSDALANGSSYPSLTISVGVPSNAPGSVTNSATVGGGGETNTSNDTATDPTTITATVVTPILTVGSSHSGNFKQGDAADSYTITVHNATGAGSTTGTVTVTDTLPTGLTPNTFSGSGWTTSIAGQTVTATRSDTLATGLSYPTLTLTVGVASNAPASVTNSVTVGGGGPSNIASGSDPTTITPLTPNLAISANPNGAFKQGDASDSYTVTVSNSAGAGPTIGTVTVTETLPTGLTPKTFSGSGWTTSISGSTVTATRSDALAGGSSYPALTLTVSVAINAPASVTGNVTVTGTLTSGGGQTVLASTSVPTAITPIPPILTVNSTHSGSFKQGDAADSFTVTVSNGTNAGSTTGTVTVTDTIPAGLTPKTISGSGWTTNISGQTVTATRSDVLAGSASYPALTLTVSVANNASASVTNSVAVAGGGQTNAASGSDLTAITQVSDLTVTSSHNGNFTQGDSADSYTIHVANVGPGATVGLVTVTDTLPAGLTPTAANGTGWTTSIVGSTVTATRSDVLASGGSFPALVITVGVAGNAASSVTNSPKVAGGGELNTANDTANDVTAISQAASLTINISHAGNFQQGDSADQYAIVVANVGPGPTSGVVTVTDTLPTGLTPTVASGSGWTTSIVGSTFTATRSDVLNPGGSYPTLTLTVQVANNASASVLNSVSVAGGGPSNTGNIGGSDRTTIVPAGALADLTISSSHVGNFNQGDSSDVETVIVTNVGSAATTGSVVITDELPATFTFISISGAGWTGGSVVSTPGGPPNELVITRTDPLAAGASAPALTITFGIKNNAPAQVTNSAQVQVGNEVNTANNTANDSISVSQFADLAISATHTGIFHQGDAADNYVITVSNVGSAPTSGTVTVADNLPIGMTATAAVGTGWTTSISPTPGGFYQVVATRSDALTSGSYPALTITFSIASNTAANVTNTAVVSGGGELNTVNDTATDPTTISAVVVNQPPSFTKGADQHVTDQSPAQSVAGWATNISPGSASEASQTVAFIVTNNNNALFSAQPAIDATGELTFTPKPNANGTATVTVVAKDSGGTANGGGDTSASQTFSIVVAKVNLWHNVVSATDVDGDSVAAPHDALLVINELNRLPQPISIPSNATNGPPYYDVNADGFVTPQDVLVIINALNHAAGTAAFATATDTLAAIPAVSQPTQAILTNDVGDQAQPISANVQPAISIANANPSMGGQAAVTIGGSTAATANSNLRQPTTPSTQPSAMSASAIDAVLQESSDWFSL